ncbi:MAG: hypothetical protein QXL94_00200 [Candidatus Parvarchaeum sp.]
MNARQMKAFFKKLGYSDREAAPTIAAALAFFQKYTEENHKNMKAD